MRGNHDAHHGQTAYAGDQWIELPGLAIALLDTTIPLGDAGALRPDQIEWLDDHLATAGRTLLLGHHQQWVPGGDGPERRSDDYFGLHPDSSDALDAVCARHRNVIGYAAGHTHRHRVRRMAVSGRPTIEVGCVKDFPGTWAEYRVFEGGVMQVVHRISDPEALRWSNRCRVPVPRLRRRLRAVRDGRPRRPLLRHDQPGLTVETPAPGIRQRGVRARCHTPWSSCGAWKCSQSS